MENLYLIAYYEINMKWYYSVLKNGVEMEENGCTGTDIHDLARKIRWEMDRVNVDIPVGLINMVPDHEEDSNAHRLSRIHEANLMRRLFKE
jgi:hypothetical protein